jgi:hypothetical protein
MARSCTCRSCGSTIRPRARDMSLGAAVRVHYWRRHREVMLGRRPTAPMPAATRSRRKAAASSGSW